MKRKIRSLVGVSLALLALMAGAAPRSAQAQWAVVDVPHLAQTVANYYQMIKEYERQYEELQEAVKQVEAITGNYGLGELVNSLLHIEGRRYAPEEWDEMLDILEAEGLPPHVFEIVDLVGELKELYRIIERDEYNLLDPDSPNAVAFERRTQTNLAAQSIAETSYDKSYERLAAIEEMILAIDATENIKAAADLQARIAAETGLAAIESIRLQTVRMNQDAALEAQKLVDETNFRRQIRFEDLTLEELAGGS